MGRVSFGRFAAGALALCCACSVGEFEDGTSFGDPIGPPATGDGTTGGQDGSMTTGVTAFPPTTGTGEPDPSETSGSDPTEPDASTTMEETTSADTSSGGAVGDGSSSSGAGVECGNGVLEEGEACDGAELDGMTCQDAGEFTGGELACSARCMLDTSGCTEPMEPVEVCENTNLAIPDNGPAVTVTPTVPPGGSVSNVMVSVDLVHTFIGDLTIDVTHAGTTVRVYNEECGTEDDMNLSFDDAGAAISCGASTSGAATLPTEALSAFDGGEAGGTWQFSFQDNAGLDTGTVMQVCVRVE